MRLVIGLVVAVTALAQNAARIPSPFTTHREILRKGEAFDVAALMRRLDLPVKFAFEGKVIGFHRSSLHAEIHPCAYNIYLLALCYEINRYCRLVAFEGDSIAKPEESWKVRGYIDDANWRGFHFDQIESWFVLTRHVGSGTGVAEYERSWFELTSAGFLEVLQNTYRGHRAFAGERMVEWRVQFLDIESHDNADSLQFLYYARLYGVDRKSFTDARRLVTFTRPNGSPKYHFDAARSELTEKDIKTFFTARAVPNADAFRAFVRRGR